MGIRSTITLTDGAITPINHAFQPVPAKGDVLRWIDRTVTTVPVGQDMLTLLQRTPSKQSKNYRFSWKLQKKTLEQTSPSTGSGIQPAPTLAYENLAIVEFVVNERSTLAERKDLLIQMRDLMTEAIGTSLVQDLDLIY